MCVWEHRKIRYGYVKMPWLPYSWTWPDTNYHLCVSYYNKHISKREELHLKDRSKSKEKYPFADTRLGTQCHGCMWVLCDLQPFWLDMTDNWPCLCRADRACIPACSCLDAQICGGLWSIGDATNYTGAWCRDPFFFLLFSNKICMYSSSNWFV